jgi:leucyl-tRNA synthetase
MEGRAPPAADILWAMNEAVNVLVPLLALMMPPLAEECWTMLGHDTLVAEGARPAVERDIWSRICWRCRYKLTAKSGQSDRRARDQQC